MLLLLVSLSLLPATSSSCIGMIVLGRENVDDDDDDSADVDVEDEDDDDEEVGGAEDMGGVR